MYYFLTPCLRPVWFGRREREFVLCSVLPSIMRHEDRSPLLLSLYRGITIPILESFQQWQKNFITTIDWTSKQFKLLSVPLQASLILMRFLQKAPNSVYFSNSTSVYTLYTQHKPKHLRELFIYLEFFFFPFTWGVHIFNDSNLHSTWVSKDKESISVWLEDKIL